MNKPTPFASAKEANADPLVRVNIHIGAEQVYATELDGVLTLGRQRRTEPPPYTRIGERVIIARLEESDISREHLRFEMMVRDEVRITNLSRINTIIVGTDQKVAPGDQLSARLPTLVTVADRIVQLEAASGLDSSAGLESFVHQTVAPGTAPVSGDALVEALSARRNDADTEYLLRGLHATVGLFQLTTDVDEFLAMAAQALIDVVGLERAAALSWDGEQWLVVALRLRAREPDTEDLEWLPSRTILGRVRDERKTFWRVPNDGAASLVDIKALVAAPILNRRAEVVGALYGDRRRRPDGRIDLEITAVEAILVELLSTSVSAGMARLAHEQAAIEAQVLFEQFFTPELSRQLQERPDLLLGKDTEVSLLCCDIRRFSEVSEQLGARLTIDWIHDVMETLSQCVARQHGVLVDTLGDRLIGMWGAPVERQDHAQLACQAAVEMIQQLPALNRRWQSALAEPMDLGIGIHTGPARVGNIGSTSKFKYGPLGTTVRIAGRVEQATSELQTQVLITGATAERLDEQFAIRRLVGLDVDDAEAPLQLYELAADPPANWDEMKRLYEAALTAFDRADWPTATRLLGKILSEHPHDRGALLLLRRISEIT